MKNLMKSKKLWVLLTLCLAALIAPYISRQIPRQYKKMQMFRAYGQVKSSTFTLVTNGYTGSPVTPAYLAAKDTIAVSGDGSIVHSTEAFRADGTFSSHIRVIHHTEGPDASVFDHLKMKWTMIRSTESVVGLRTSRPNPDADCASPYVGQFHKVFKVLGHKVINVPKGGTITATLLDGSPKLDGTQVFADAPTLGCETVEQDVKLSADGEFSSKRVESVTYGEPDPALFTIPADYQEANATAVGRAMAARAGKTYKPTDFDLKLDQMYSNKTHW